MELLEGLCSKVEVYELMGRSTQDTETEVSPDMDKMTWQRADPDNMAHKVNVRIGLVSPKPGSRASSLPSATASRAKPMRQPHLGDYPGASIWWHTRAHAHMQ